MNAPANSKTRIIKLCLPEVDGQPVEFELMESEGMTLLCALGQIQDALPPPLKDRFVCHAGACNTCQVLIDGQPGVACTTFIRDLGNEIRVAPGEHAQGWGEHRVCPRAH